MKVAVLEVFVEEVQKCVSSQEREKWMYGVHRKLEGEDKELDLLVSRVREISYGGLAGNNDGMGGVGILVKELFEMVVEVRRQSDRVMAMVLVFEEEDMRVLCAFWPHVGRSAYEKNQFGNEMSREWDLQNEVK